MYKIEIFTDQFVFASVAMIDKATTVIEQDYLAYDNYTIQTPAIECEKGYLVHITDENNVFVADGIVGDVKPKDEMQDISIRPLNALFDAELFYTPVSDCISWLATNIDSAFMSNTDTLQNRPITLTYTQSVDALPLTGFNLHETVNILSVMVSAMKTYGVVVASRLDLPNKRFTVNIYQQTATKVLEASLENVLQKSVTIGDSYGSTNKAIIRKIRVVDDVTTVLGQTEFYLHPNGTIDTTDGNRIVPVFWELESLELDDDMTENEWQAAALSRAKEILTPAKFDNEIILQYDRDDLLARPADMLIGTATTIYLDGNTYASILTGKRIEGQKITLIFGVTRTELTKQLSIKQRETLTYQNTVSAINKIVEKRIAGGGSSVEPSTTTPKMDGTAAIGTEQKYARGDHVHPTDTTRLSVTDAQNTYATKASVQNMLDYGLKYRGYVNDITTDLNNLKTRGIYATSAVDLTNAPPVSVYKWRFISVYTRTINGNADTMVNQIMFDVGGALAFRSFAGGSSGTWSKWAVIQATTENMQCTGASNITFSLNEAELNANTGYLAIQFRSSTALNGYASTGITVPTDLKPSISRNVYVACDINGVKIANWQVLDTGVIRCGTAIPANVLVSVSIIYPVK